MGEEIRLPDGEGRVSGTLEALRSRRRTSPTSATFTRQMLV